MNPTIKKKWINALRSGKYKQTTENLKVGNSFCCLGVLCDIVKTENKNFNWRKDPNHGWAFGNSTVSMLPKIVADKVGLPAGCVKVYIPRKDADNLFGGKLDSLRTNLAYLNDEAGADFDTIATVIEKYL